ncbi:hypothetical protein CFIO01_00090 [Colletotrichum fioriniae PJ7]|uniref:Protein kinase domain-containing protein n=1 Tax=Colletotrichum fioriniae PJ7 TaxID=1445577 RepID=A0A010SNC4_9PEZI|nr:hypothetical protein CFIO01_00090 [Colletotrichum fioriniae PJ7]
MNGDEYERAAEAEAEVLQMIREMEHPHLIKAIAYYKRGDRYFIIFPWAGGGNLRDYWGREPHKLDENFVGWAIGQLCGLASAMKKLHSAKDSACRHGDLKPENILCFEDARSIDSPSQPLLVIADVGLAKVHTLATEMRNEATRTMNGTVIRKASFLGDSDFPHSIDTYVRGMKIELYQDLYQKYSGLALSSIGDRPIAIRGLEARLIRTFKTVGSHGVFDTFFHRCLLWKKASRSLGRIDSELLRGVYVPSWSWMAYDGEIKYLNVPYNKYSWEGDIISPFRTWLSQSIKERGEEEAACVIKAPVWAFRAPKNLQLELDNPDRKLSNINCVIVASKKDLQGDPQQSHYIIVVHSVAIDGPGEVYERVGVAEVRRNQIAFNEGSHSGILR